MAFTRTCRECGVEYEPSDPRNTGYCSRQCFQRTRRVQHRATCVVCGREFPTTRGSRPKYCSGGCRASAQTGPAPRLIPCAQCGESFQPGTHTGQRFCSKACAGIARRGKRVALGTSTCVGCGKRFEMNRQGQRFCTRDCYYRNPGAQDAPPVVACPTCGVSLKATRTGNSARRKYCSMTCRRKAEAKGTRPRSPTIDGHGYVRTGVTHDDPLWIMADRHGYVPEHRLVMARHLGRPLTSNESVHHKDGNRQNNDIDNLQLRVGQHGRGVALRCRCCGSTDLKAVTIT